MRQGGSERSERSPEVVVKLHNKKNRSGREKEVATGGHFSWSGGKR